MSELALQKIKDLLKERKVVLFLGAGASAASGAPVGSKLFDILKDKFKDVKSSADNLFDLCEDVSYTPGYTITDVENVVKDYLRSLKPSPWHEVLAKQNWSAIFTTNYDVLIERAYENNNALRVCKTVSTAEFSSPVVDINSIYLYKLMGSIIDNEEGSNMILTRYQYNENFQKRKDIFSLLYSYVGAGTIVFCGYSGNDRLLFDTLDRAIEKKTFQRLPWSYAILDHEPDERETNRFRALKIIPINCTFQQFMEWLNTEGLKPLESTLPRSKSQVAKVLGQAVTIPAVERSQSEKMFELLTPESFVGKATPEEFFHGNIFTWIPFEKGWDFLRDSHLADALSKDKQPLIDRVKAELSSNLQVNRVLILTGSPGCGKTMMAKRLALESYKEGYVVLWIDPTKDPLDFRFIANFLENLERELKGSSTQRIHVKPLIVLDDCPTMSLDPLRLASYLSSTGQSAVIVATGRENEWEDLPNYRRSDTYKISTEISDSEKPRLIRHLARMGFIDSKSNWESFVSLGIEESFFAALYIFVDHARRRLDEIIRDQFEKLSPEAKQMYVNIAALHQFGLMINEELLIRSLQQSYSSFFDTLNSREAIGLVFDYYTSYGQTYYRTQHPIMARKTIQFFLPTKEAKKQLFEEILSDVNLSNANERQVIERLFVRHLSSKSRDTDLTIDQKRDLFKLVCDQRETRTILHHWARLETDDSNFERAEDLLNRALAKSAFSEGYRGESQQNILTSMGRMYSLKGFALQDKGDSDGAELAFEKADTTFLSARSKGLPNVYSFHFHIFMYYLRAEKSRDEFERSEFLSKALKMVLDAEESLSAESLAPIQELKVKIYALLGDEEKVRGQITLMAERYKSGRGYFLYASFLLGKQMWNDYDEVLSVVNEGLSRFPFDEGLLTLKARIVSAVAGHDPSVNYAALVRWYLNTKEHTAQLLYELAVASFLNEQYEESKRYFTELNEISFFDRTRLRYMIKDRSGATVRFRGKVESVQSGGRGGITSTQFINLKTPLFFRPFLCNFNPRPNMNVSFSLGFSMIGPVAFDVTQE